MVSELHKGHGATSQITQGGECLGCLVSHLPPAISVSKRVNSVLPVCSHSTKSDPCWILSESQVASLSSPLVDGLETISLAEIQLHSRQGHTND